VGAPLQRVDVEELGTAGRHGRQDPVVDGALDRVGVARVPGGEQQPPGQHDARDRGARLGVGAVGRQLERVAERLVLVPAAHPAGEIGARAHQVQPATLDSGEQVVVAGLDGHVDGAAVEVELAHRVARHRRRGAHRCVVLPVRRAEPALAEQPVAAQVHHPRRQREVAPVAGDPAEFHQRHLDARVPVDALLAVRAELRVDVGDGPPRDVQQPVVAEGAVPRHGRLDEVAEAVELVPPLEILVGRAAPDDLDEAVEVPVRPLGRGHHTDRLVGRGGQVRVGPAAQFPADGFEPLVDVGVEEGEGGSARVGQCPVVAVQAGGQPQVVQRAGVPQPREAVRDRRLAVDPLPVGEEAVDDGDLGGADRPQA
jgi:hypothetical protein